MNSLKQLGAKVFHKKQDSTTSTSTFGAVLSSPLKKTRDKTLRHSRSLPLGRTYLPTDPEVYGNHSRPTYKGKNPPKTSEIQISRSRPVYRGKEPLSVSKIHWVLDIKADEPAKRPPADVPDDVSVYSQPDEGEAPTPPPKDWDISAFLEDFPSIPDFTPLPRRGDMLPDNPLYARALPAGEAKAYMGGYAAPLPNKVAMYYAVPNNKPDVTFNDYATRSEAVVPGPDRLKRLKELRREHNSKGRGQERLPKPPQRSNSATPTIMLYPTEPLSVNKSSKLGHTKAATVDLGNTTLVKAVPRHRAVVQNPVQRDVENLRTRYRTPQLSVPPKNGTTGPTHNLNGANARLRPTRPTEQKKKLADFTASSKPRPSAAEIGFISPSYGVQEKYSSATTGRLARPF